MPWLAARYSLNSRSQPRSPEKGYLAPSRYAAEKPDVTASSCMFRMVLHTREHYCRKARMMTYQAPANWVWFLPFRNIIHGTTL